jgi:hypothetical protein
MAEMFFTDEKALDGAMRSGPGKAAARDFREFAASDIQMFVAKVWE